MPEVSKSEYIIATEFAEADYAGMICLLCRNIIAGPFGKAP